MNQSQEDHYFVGVLRAENKKLRAERDALRALLRSIYNDYVLPTTCAEKIYQALGEEKE